MNIDVRNVDETMKNPRCIAISGVDGSGKTTLANWLVKYLRFKGYKTKYVWIRAQHTLAYLISQILIHLGWYRTFRNPNGILVSRFKVHEGTFARKIWPAIEFVSVLPLIIFKIKLPLLLGYRLVLDRYLADTIVSIVLTTRNMSFADSSIGRLLLKMMSKDCAVIFLDAGLSTVLRRKPDVEYSNNEIKNEINLYRVLARKVKAFSLNPTTQSIEQIRKKVVDLLLAESMPKFPVMHGRPMITIGILTYNSSWSLPSVLEAVNNLEHPKDRTRIVFADNNSQDETLPILRDFKARMESYYESIIIISHELRKSGNIPEGRNICVTNSIGEYILFTDSDVAAPPDTVKRMLELFASNPNAAIAGFPCLSSPMNFLDKLDFYELPKQQKPEVKDVIGMGCTMVKRKLFNEIGLFDLEYSTREDYEISRRASKAGYIILLDISKRALHLKQNREALREIINHCFVSLAEDARHRFMILHKYKPRWMIARLGIYSALIASFLLAISGIFLKEALLSLPFISCFAFVFIYHFLKSSGRWRLINPIPRILFGVFFALGIYWQAINNYLVNPCKRAWTYAYHYAKGKPVQKQKTGG